MSTIRKEQAKKIPPCLHGGKSYMCVSDEPFLFRRCVDQRMTDRLCIERFGVRDLSVAADLVYSSERYGAASSERQNVFEFSFYGAVRKDVSPFAEVGYQLCELRYGDVLDKEDVDESVVAFGVRRNLESAAVISAVCHGGEQIISRQLT